MRIMNKTKLCLALASVALAPVFAHAAPASAGGIGGTYQVVTKYPVTGAEGWDYLAFDGKRSRLFISRVRHVQVMDTKTGKLIGEIPDTDGVHGIVFDQDLKLGFTSNGKANTVTVFNLDTLATVDTIKVSGVKPDFIYFEPTKKRVYTSNAGSDNISAIDPVTRKVVATIALDGNPEAMVSDKDGSHLFVNVENKNELAKIDVKAGKVVATWPMPACDEPTGIAFDKKHDRVFSVCHSASMMVVDAKTGNIVSQVETDKLADAAYFDEKQSLIYSTDGAGSLMVVHQDKPDAYTVQSKVATMLGAKTLAVDPKTHRAYTISAQFGPAPAPTAENPHPRGAIVPDSVVILVAEPTASK